MRRRFGYIYDSSKVLSTYRLFSDLRFPEKKYSELNLLPRPPKKSWKTPPQVQSFLESAARQLHVTSLSDWYRIGTAQIVELGGMCDWTCGVVIIRWRGGNELLKIGRRRYAEHLWLSLSSPCLCLPQLSLARAQIFIQR